MFIEYITPRIHKLLERRFLLELFTYMPDRAVASADVLPDGTIVFLKAGMTSDTAKYGYYENGKLVNIPLSKYNKGAPFSFYDKVLIKSKHIHNYKGTGELTTTIGRFVTNYFLIVDSIGDLIPYVNTEWDISGIENQYARLILDGKINVSHYRKYLDNGYFLGHFGELCVPTITARSLTTDPRVIKRKKELLDLHKGELDDPKVVSKIEQELIAMDRAWIKGDPSEGFYGADPKKGYSIHRKKMFIMVGGIDDFSKEGSLQLVNHALSDGMDKNNFVAIANEIRKGSYSRGNETQEGGAQTKVIFRAFQDIKIIEDDCKTDRGIPLTFVDMIKPNMFLGRIVITGNKQVEITRDNLHLFEGKSVLLRSPMTCKTSDGLCYNCCGTNFKRLGIITPGVQAIEISSKFMANSMKLMHGQTIATEVIDPFECFVD